MGSTDTKNSREQIEDKRKDPIKDAPETRARDNLQD